MSLVLSVLRVEIYFESRDDRTHLMGWVLYYHAKAAKTKYKRLGGSNNRNLFSHISGG